MQKAKAELKPSERTYHSEPDSFRWRWQHIKRLNPEQIDKLHAVETRWWLAQKEAKKAEKQLPHEDNWISRGHALLVSWVEELGSFWPARAPEAWKEAELARWKSYSFRVWRPVWDKYDQGGISEMEAVHAVDKALIRDAYVYPPGSVAGNVGGDRFKSAAQPAYEPGADKFDFKDAAAGDSDTE